MPELNRHQSGSCERANQQKLVKKKDLIAEWPAMPLYTYMRI